MFVANHQLKLHCGPARLWPVLAVGFKDLLARSAAQSSALDENSQRLKSLNDIAHNLARCGNGGGVRAFESGCLWELCGVMQVL